MGGTPASRSGRSPASSPPGGSPTGGTSSPPREPAACASREWLPDDPFPRAEVELLGEPGPPSEARATRDDVERLLKRVLAMSAEVGDAPQSIDVVLDDDPAQAAFEAAAAAPIGPLDAQRLLEIDDPGERLTQLQTLLADAGRARSSSPALSGDRSATRAGLAFAHDGRSRTGARGA